MVYKFILKSEDQAHFLREIVIDADATFLALRNAILDSVGYSKDEMDAFYLCDRDWRRREAVTLVDMETDTDEDVWLMDDTHLNELIEEKGQRLVFQYDNITDRVFNMELREIIPRKNLMDPICTRKEGKVPPQVADLDAFNQELDAQVAAAKVAATELDPDLDVDLYGGHQYNDEELPEGFEDFN